MTKFALPTPIPSEFKSKEETLVRNGRTIFAVVGDVALLDVAARNSVVPEVHAYLDKIAAATQAAKLELRYVSNIRGFFNPDERWTEFLTTGKTSGVALTDEEIEASKLVLGMRQRFDTAFTLPKVPYAKLELPKGVTNPLAGVKVTGSRVQNGSGYSLSLTQVKRLWDAVAPVWAKNGRKTLRRQSLAGYTKSPSVTPKNLIIGCQTIPRYKLEALAEKQGWTFPETEA